VPIWSVPSDSVQSRQRYIDSNDTFIRQWGSFGNGTGQFSETASGIAVDNNGHVFVIDKINSRVQMFDMKGNYLAGWGTSGKDTEQLNKPEDIDVVNHGGIYITDTRNSRVQILGVVGWFIERHTFLNFKYLISYLFLSLKTLLFSSLFTRIYI
jgi:DNA-binding beta-propeller fold protein YncE